VTLRKKTVLILCFSAILIVSLIIVASRGILFQRYMDLEKENLSLNSRRIESILMAQQDRYASYARDWAVWDSAYEYVTAPNRNFENENLVLDTFESLGIHFLVFADAKGNLIPGSGYDFQKKSEIPLPDSLSKVLGRIAAAVNGRRGDPGREGIFSLPEGLFLVATHPVLRSDGSGPAAGSIFMVRRVDEAFLARISSQAGIPVSLLPLNSSEVPARLLIEAEETGRRGDYRIEGDQIAGFLLLKDMNGIPIGAMKFLLPRQIYDQGRRTLTIFVALFVFFSVGIIAIVLFLLDKVVLSRLSRLSAEVQAISASEDLGRRVTVDGRDELATLENKVNLFLSALQKSTGKLKAANQELQDFAYVVSHDLKAPLRGISTLAGWISTDNRESLDEEGKEKLELLLVRVRRMNDLIDGILKYSRVGRSREEAIPVDCNSLVAETVDLLAPGENFTVTVQEGLPTVTADRTKLGEVFQNLISNAIKYIDKPHGQIRIGCDPDGKGWRFFVADNGPGIEEKYHEKVFQIFQTLGSKDTPGSTGVGLAVVKKIVEQMGGEIWIESCSGQGTTFFFTIPFRFAETQPS
jgi:signal transduction histidine kinase